MEWTITLRDVYDWELFLMHGFYNLSHDDLARMHRYGDMKFFVVTDSCRVKVEWEQGQRVGSGARYTILR